MPFNNPILAGELLTRSGIKSENYVAGSSGWRIARDGGAEFNSIVVRDTLQSDNYVPDVSGWHLDEDGSAEFNDLQARGEWSTGTSGERFVIPPGVPEIRAYPLTGINYGAFTSGTQQLSGTDYSVIGLQASGVAYRGTVTVHPSYALIGMYDIVNDVFLSDILCGIDLLIAVTDGDVGFRTRDSAGNYIPRASLNYTADDPPRMRPSFRSSQGNIRLLFDDVGDELQVLNWAGDAYRPIAASAFPVRSTRDTKTNIRNITRAEAQTIIDNAPAALWHYVDDVHEVTHCGPMADDLPAWMVDSQGRVDIRDLIGVLWKASESEDV